MKMNMWEFFAYSISGFWTWLAAISLIVLLAAAVGDVIGAVARAIPKRTVSVHSSKNHVSVQVSGAKKKDIEEAARIAKQYGAQERSAEDGLCAGLFDGTGEDDG